MDKGELFCQSRDVADILQQIVEHKRTEVEAARRAVPPGVLEQRLSAAPPVRDFVGALRAAHPMGLVAEIKRASPSAGLIRADFDPISIAHTYAAHGAACLSVLTDARYFQGQLGDLVKVRAAVNIPVLRKDFLIDPYQVVEARAAGADCVLLIAECLNDQELRSLYGEARALGMSVLIELYELSNVDRVLALDPPLMGVNNRDLRTMTTDLAHCLAVRQRVPRDILLVAESGIRTRSEVVRLQEAGIHAMLVGESLMRADDVGAAVDGLLGR